ncbi:transposase [Endozoicomonas gorgoniicola]|uniref:Transposase n=1 Tax=Endozoicomonas gorgoniicola TaxID=1234144 RepID=A0ABT3N3S6_9GAMM|nr:transposase [Endozoicomonas gorgoniicola]MCW7554566.1 transposase [Endozoicomonas gorgoniicola]MCW7555128.1 transposase [Endozoicomonas gorgoniicola]MCW7556287.1 transposase [Endozoicomonas gorgoniicola]
MNKRAFKYRFYPTPEQETLLAQTFGCIRFVYNHILRWRTDEYYNNGCSINYNAASKQLTELKKNPEYQWLKDVSSVPVQQALRHQQTAFKNFWEGRAKYPTFKKRHAKQSATFAASAFKYKEGQLFIAKSKEPLNIRWSRELSSEPSSITISKDRAGRYFVSMLCEFEAKPMPISNKTVGIDLGLNDLFVTSDGQKSGNPRHTKRYEQKLAYLQRKLVKKQKSSNNRAKAKLKVARLHAKIADCRMDATHKASRKLINENQVVCVESLNVKGMIKNPKLAKHIADANWGEFVRQLQYKAEWAERIVVQIDRFFPSSRRCSSCGFIHESLPLSIREWKCPKCNTLHDRDINAAINIKTAGLAGLACGATGTGVAA